MDMSFLIDPFLLIFSGIAEVYLCEKILCKHHEKKNVLLFLSVVIIFCFWIIAGALYLDYLNIPFLGDYGRGNHFMWNSGVEIIGLKPFIDTSVPTYKNTLSSLNLLAILIFATYPLWLYFGIRVGYKILRRA